MTLLLLLACGGAPSTDTPTGPPSSTETGTTPTGDTGSGTTPTATSGSTAGTGSTGSSGTTGDTGTTPTWDCATLPSTPAVSPVLGPPPSEDFAFDELGNLASFNGTLLVLTDFAGTSTPIAMSSGSGGGPASLRYLPGSGHFVFHDVDTSTLYEVDPVVGSVVPVFSGFGYAGAIEVRSDELLYVVDLVGVHLIDPTTGDHELTLERAPWSQPNGATLSVDGATLYVGASQGVYAVPLDGDGRPNGAPVLWSAAPAGATELLGMGVDACDNVYMVGKGSGGSGLLWRYPAGGGAPVALMERSGFFTNLQWGSGVGGWDDMVLYVVDRAGGVGPGYLAVEVGVPEKPR
mgnify:CR=1 FL=1